MKKTLIFISTMFLCLAMFSCKNGSDSASANAEDSYETD